MDSMHTGIPATRVRTERKASCWNPKGSMHWNTHGATHVPKGSMHVGIPTTRVPKGTMLEYPQLAYVPSGKRRTASDRRATFRWPPTRCASHANSAQPPWTSPLRRCQASTHDRRRSGRDRRAWCVPHVPEKRNTTHTRACRLHTLHTQERNAVAFYELYLLFQWSYCLRYEDGPRHTTEVVSREINDEQSVSSTFLNTKHSRVCRLHNSTHEKETLHPRYSVLNWNISEFRTCKSQTSGSLEFSSETRIPCNFTSPRLSRGMYSPRVSSHATKNTFTMWASLNKFWETASWFVSLKGKSDKQDTFTASALPEERGSQRAAVHPTKWNVQSRVDWVLRVTRLESRFERVELRGSREDTRHRSEGVATSRSRSWLPKSASQSEICSTRKSDHINFGSTGRKKCSMMHPGFSRAFFLAWASTRRLKFWRERSLDIFQATLR